MRLWIGGPTRDTVPARFALDLAQLYAKTRERGPWSEVLLGFVESTYVHVGREAVLKAALQMKADHLLWLDTDMTFPPETANRLVAHDQSVVGCNCLMRDPRQLLWTSMRDGARVPTLPSSTGLEHVDSLGLAVLLMRTDIVARMPSPLFRHGWNLAKQCDVGEDITFCRILSSEGHAIYIDHDLSKEIGHIGHYTYKPAVSDAAVAV